MGTAVAVSGGEVRVLGGSTLAFNGGETVTLDTASSSSWRLDLAHELVGRHRRRAIGRSRRRRRPRLRVARRPDPAHPAVLLRRGEHQQRAARGRRRRARDRRAARHAARKRPVARPGARGAWLVRGRAAR